MGYQPPPTPDALKEPRVVVGKGFLTRNNFAKTTWLESVKGIGRIDDVAVGEFDPSPGLDVIVAGNFGVRVFDLNGVQHTRTVFQFRTVREKVGPIPFDKEQTMLGDVKVVDLEGDGISEYLMRGSLDGGGLFDHQGKLLWTYGKFTEEKTSIDDLTAGDLDGDGIAELVVSWNGIEVFDKGGNKRSQLTEEYSGSQIEVIDTDGDGKNEIVSAGGTLKVRDATGRVIKNLEIPIYLGKFSLCQMPGQKQPVILSVQDNSLWLIDLQGKTVAQFNAPLSEFPETVQRGPNGEEFHGTSVYKSSGVWLTSGKIQKYLAVISEFAAIDRAVLDVFTASGELVYQEVLPEASHAIVVLPPADSSDASEFLVAGEQTVWRYRVNSRQ